ncbi:PREDICTED: probable ATP-dependent DNA helicase HFM1, partial [Rhagoletis zephyria]|uniref:probable ATP-dependent DNA helicase HFM1 n=1 Tax=Rhagoletis zephyria TaxID=28612 RepID=UPI0008112A02
VCAPTGSGKTVLLEMAIVRELMKIDCGLSAQTSFKDLHILYLAPLKAIVEEKCNDWHKKFSSFGLKCFALTGDTEFDDYSSVQVFSYTNINIILTTPEKFDHVIRTDPRSRELLRVLKLILIDEVHILSDRQRGDVLEATITRIKALRSKHNSSSQLVLPPLRFIAISATVPNVSDVAAWLDSSNGMGVTISQNLRPVKLEKIVLGYDPIPSARASEYRFEIQLSYKVEAIIRAHSDSKPVIVFSSTRKSVEFTAKVLAASNETYFFSDNHRDEYFNEVSKLINANFDISSGFIYDNESYFKNVDLKTCLASGVGFYHSGMDPAERRLLEKLFAKSLIPVLVSTSSLAMGVNLPAHMVIIKNTVQYLAGKTIEYDSAQVLQMIGRAGRSQFDVTAKAVIMTETSKKNFYDTLLNSDKAIESVLPLTLIEQLMIEIVLRTVTSIETTVEWICSTFMYIRIVSNPSYYGSSIAKGDIKGSLPFIFNWSHENINKLANLSLINMKPESNSFEPTHLARIVTRYGISIKSTELLFKMLKEGFNLKMLLEKLSECQELSSDIILRVSEKKFLNEYSKSLRFKSKDKIKNSSMKINCLLQATFESIQIDSTLTQDSSNLVRRGQRITKCFVEICLYLFSLPKYSSLKEKFSCQEMHFETIASAVLLSKSFRAQLWHDSKFVSKQLSEIGPVLSRTLVEKGYDSFEKIMDENPRNIEFCLHRNPPFGSYLQEEIKSLPNYDLSLTKVDLSCDFKFLANQSIQSLSQVRLDLSIKQGSSSKPFLNPKKHSCILVVGCQECNYLLSFERTNDEVLQSCGAILKNIIVVQTKFAYANDSSQSKSLAESPEFEALFEMSSQMTKGNKKQKISIPMPAPKKTKIDPSNVAQIKREDTSEFLNFVNKMTAAQNEEFVNHSKTNQFIFHYTYGNHQRHTIQAMFVSESFVGLDVEAKLALSFSTTVYPKSKRQLNSVQQTLICKDNQLRFSSSKDEHQIGLASSSSSIVNPFSSTVSSINLTDHELVSTLNDTIFITDEDESDNTNEVISVKSEINIASDISSAQVPSTPSEVSQVDNGSQYESASYIYSTQKSQRDRRNYFPTRVLPSQEYTASPYFAKKANK